MPENRMSDIKRNPYMQIARKLVQTYNVRKNDIKAIKSEIARINSNQQPRYGSQIADLRQGTDGRRYLNADDKLDTLETHLDCLMRWNEIIDNAFDLAVADIEDDELRMDTRKALIRSYGDDKQVDFYMLAYPIEFGRNDYEERSRTLLKYIIREIGLMPYLQPIKFKPKSKADRTKRKRRVYAMRIRPLHKNIVVRPSEQPKNEYGILIVQEEKKSETIGEVISCGEAVQSVAVGNKVLYARYAGSPVTIDGEELTVMHEADVLAVLG